MGNGQNQERSRERASAKEGGESNLLSIGDTEN